MPDANKEFVVKYSSTKNTKIMEQGQTEKKSNKRKNIFEALAVIFAAAFSLFIATKKKN